MEPPASTGRQSRYGEVRKQCGLLVGSWVAFVVITGVTYQVPPLLLPALKDAFGVSEYEVAFLPAIFQMSRGLATLPTGFAIHRFGVVRCMRVGAVLVLVASACYPVAPSFWVLGVLHAAYGIGWNLSGVNAMIVLMAFSFDRQRSLAIGIMLTGFTAAGFLVTPLVALFLDHYGWRVASAVCPVATALLVLPTIFCVIRPPPPKESDTAEDGSKAVAKDCTPSDASKLESGAAGDQASGVRAAPSESSKTSGTEAAEADAVDVDRSPFLRMLQRRETWHLAFLGMYWYYVMIGIVNTLVLFLNEQLGDMSISLVSFYFAVANACSMVGNLLAGFAQDYGPRMACAVRFGGSVWNVGGTVLVYQLPSLALADSRAQLLVFAIVYGIGWGLGFSVLASTPARIFGGDPEFAKLQAFLSVFQIVGAITGTLVTGKLRVSTGSYELPFYIFTAVAVASCFHTLPLALRALRPRAIG